MKYYINFKLYGIIITLSSLSILTSCIKEDPNPQGIPKPTYINVGKIGPQGGKVTTSDGALVEIPASALNDEQNISLTNTTETIENLVDGCKVYEFKPNGLTFNDSITISLPFDKTYLDLNSPEDNYGIGIMTFAEGTWIIRKSEVDLTKNLVSVKTNHFSSYVAYYPSSPSNYFASNKSNAEVKRLVPHYMQGETNWCGFYSLSMVTKFAGYYQKAPYQGKYIKSTFVFSLTEYQLSPNPSKLIGYKL